MKFQLIVLALFLGAVYGQYGADTPTETEAAANPAPAEHVQEPVAAAPAEHTSEPVPAAPSMDSHPHMVQASEDAPASGCPIVEPPPAPLHCTYEQVQQGGCPKPTLKCNCPANEAFVECATCEPTCDNPKPICTEECKPAQCQCKPDHARSPNGECVPVAECKQKPTHAAETAAQPPATAPETPNAPSVGQPATETCATMKCESDYDCVEHVGGCVKKNTGNCAVSPCMANHKCVENVGCHLEASSSMPHEPSVPLAMASSDMMHSSNSDMMHSANTDMMHSSNTDMMHPASHSTDVAHEETIPIPHDQPHSGVICADTKCAPGSVCIEEYGCFKPHDRFIQSANGGMVESSCERVICDKQHMRCVHGSCVPLKMPWKLGYVCSQSPCASSSMICVDDIGCFDSAPMVGAQQEEAPHSVPKTDSAPSPVPAPVDQSKTDSAPSPVPAPAAQPQTDSAPSPVTAEETKTAPETPSAPAEYAAGTNTEAEQPKEVPTAPMMDAHPETLPSMDDMKMHHGSGMPTCMECEEPRKGMNGQMMCVRKAGCCPGGMMATQCFWDPCKSFEQTCSKAKMCVAMMCGHCAAMIYDSNMMPVKVGVDNCFMPFSTTNDGDMPKHLPEHLIHS